MSLRDTHTRPDHSLLRTQQALLAAMVGPPSPAQKCAGEGERAAPSSYLLREPTSGNRVPSGLGAGYEC